MPREQKVRIMQAEALWRAGVLKVAEIAQQVDRHETLVYEWAREYHWPPRADVVAVARNALSVEVLRMAAQRARAAAQPSNDGEKVDMPAITPSVQAVPDGTIDFVAERDRRPMSEEDTRRQGISEQAAADAEADKLTREYAIALSQVVDTQRSLANEVASWGAELLRDARAHREDGKTKLAELRKQNGRKKDSTRALNESISHFSRLVTAIKVSVDLQWRVWQLDSLSAPPAGNDRDGRAPVLPMNAGSYEEYVHAAERAGRNLTPP
jgi:hypothetical protein